LSSLNGEGVVHKCGFGLKFSHREERVRGQWGVDSVKMTIDMMVENGLALHFT